MTTRSEGAHAGRRAVICEKIAPIVPVTRVTITRESCAEACTYRPQKNQPR